LLQESQVDDVRDFYHVNPKGKMTNTEKRKMTFQVIELANQGKMKYIPKDIHIAAEHNPAMIFDEEGRLQRW